ncbi:MAG: hypothetical protein ACTHQE_17710, partial [Thermomicrobiales bacterium]
MGVGVNVGVTATASGQSTGRFRFLPEGPSPDAAILIAARGIRACGDGFISILLPVHLVSLGFSATRIGVLTTATLLGSAALTLAVG